jgi:hypothetical protein
MNNIYTVTKDNLYLNFDGKNICWTPNPRYAVGFPQQLAERLAAEHDGAYLLSATEWSALVNRK